MLLFSRGVILQPFLKLPVRPGTGGCLSKGCGRSPCPSVPGMSLCCAVGGSGLFLSTSL